MTGQSAGWGGAVDRSKCCQGGVNQVPRMTDHTLPRLAPSTQSHAPKPDTLDPLATPQLSPNEPTHPPIVGIKFYDPEIVGDTPESVESVSARARGGAGGGKRVRGSGVWRCVCVRTACAMGGWVGVGCASACASVRACMCALVHQRVG